MWQKTNPAPQNAGRDWKRRGLSEPFGFQQYITIWGHVLSGHLGLDLYAP